MLPEEPPDWWEEPPQVPSTRCCLQCCCVPLARDRQRLTPAACAVFSWREHVVGRAAPVEACVVMRWGGAGSGGNELRSRGLPSRGRRRRDSPPCRGPARRRKRGRAGCPVASREAARGSRWLGADSARPRRRRARGGRGSVQPRAGSGHARQPGVGSGHAHGEDTARKPQP